MSKKSEILDALSSLKEADLKKVNEELSILESSEALDGKPNLDSFYAIWQKRKNDRAGNKNKINSWTAYFLGLTKEKPTGEFLASRRVFARASFPDIDSDFDYFRRKEVFDYLIEKYGRDRVGQIAAYGGLKLKSTVRRAGKAFDIANSFHKGKDDYVTDNEAAVKELLEHLPEQRGAFIKVKDEEGVEHIIKTTEDAYKYCPDFKNAIDKYPGLYENVRKIEGLLSNMSIHAAGVILSGVPLNEIAPLRNTRTGIATQFTHEDLESIGLIKFDLLGISTLTVIRRTLDMIRQRYGIDIDIHNINLKDEKTLDLYKTGNLVGVFQCESYGMQETMKQMEVDCFYDIVAAVALFRPGPMENIGTYCLIKKGLKKPDYFHPEIEKRVKPILEKSMGLLVFQEQIMLVCEKLAGFTKVDGYSLIKGVGKKKEDIIKKYRALFLSGCKKNNIDESISGTYWDRYIVPFAEYGFNLSHSAAYGYTSYITAYLKANFLEEFMTCYLNVENYRKNEDKVIALQKDLTKFGVQFGKKSLNFCKTEFTIAKKKDVSQGIIHSIISPSLMCKGIGYEAAQEIEKNQPYNSLRDIAFKTESKLVDLSAVEGLVLGGFFENEFSEYKKTNKRGKMLDFAKYVTEKFAAYRNEFKAAAKKGIGPETLF